MKILKFFYVLVFLSICLACQSLSFKQAPGDKITNQVISKVTKKISKKKSMRISAIGGGEDEKGIWKITVNYHYYGKALDLKESRIFMVNIIETYLNEINNNIEIRPYLKNYPFTVDNLDLAIITNQTNGDWYFDPAMDTISTINDTIDYSTRDPQDHLRYKNTIVEKYEDALKIVKDNGQLGLFD
jgi:hypothetical protein